MADSASGQSTNHLCSYDGLPVVPNPLARIRALPDSAYTFIQSDSGNIFQLGAVTAARTHVLPAVSTAAGMRLDIVVTVAPAGNTVTFQGPAGTMVGQVVTALSNFDPAVPTWGTAGNAAKRSVATGAAIVAGSTLSLYCDGTYWRALGLGQGAVGAAVLTVWAFA